MRRGSGFSTRDFRWGVEELGEGGFALVARRAGMAVEDVIAVARGRLPTVLEERKLRAALEDEIRRQSRRR